jgi:hypothetical protein
MKHLYAVDVTELSRNGESGAPENPIKFEFASHDDLGEIIARVQQKQLFPEEQTKVFCVGMKLFASVLLENRSHPLFAEFAIHFGEFMEKLKK